MLLINLRRLSLYISVFVHNILLVSASQNFPSSSICTFVSGTFEQNNSMLTASSSFKRFVSKTARFMSSISDTKTSSFTIAQFQCLDDNYGYLIHDEKTGQTAAIDTPCAKTYNEELKKRNWTLTHIFNTHHHWDHTGGNKKLKELYQSDEFQIFGPKVEESQIPGLDVPLSHGESIRLGGCGIEIIDVGGHTNGHIAYYIPSLNKVFVGDALFALGCGKMFEGTPKQFWSSLLRLRSLPDETTVYCAHEYTASNAKFAKSVEPGNQELMDRVDDIALKRKEGLPTVPTNLGVEKRTNPFLRIDVSDEIRKNVKVVEGVDDDATVFGKVRSAKDNFRG